MHAMLGCSMTCPASDAAWDQQVQRIAGPLQPRVQGFRRSHLRSSGTRACTEQFLPSELPLLRVAVGAGAEGGHGAEPAHQLRPCDPPAARCALRRCALQDAPICSRMRLQPYSKQAREQRFASTLMFALWHSRRVPHVGAVGAHWHGSKCAKSGKEAHAPLPAQASRTGQAQATSCTRSCTMSCTSSALPRGAGSRSRCARGAAQLPRCAGMCAIGFSFHVGFRLSVSGGCDALCSPGLLAK